MPRAINQMDTLTAIFGSETKVRILRLFLFNPEVPFFLPEIIERTKSPAAQVRRELSNLLKVGLLRKRLTTKDIQVEKKTKKGIKISNKKLHGLSYQLNTKFTYVDLLKTFLTVESVSADESLLKKFNSVGRLRLLIASGIFIQNWDSRVDLLIVGDELDMNRIEQIIKGVEAETGKEVAYSAFETNDFEYRFGIHDRLVRDIIDYPHVTLLDRLGVEPE